MKFKTKLAAGIVIVAFIGFSSYNFYTAPIDTGPVWKQNPDAYDLLSVTNTSNVVNLSQDGQQLSIGVYIDTKEAPWKKGDHFFMKIYMGKLSQSVSSPYTGSTAVISDVSVLANNTTVSVLDSGHQAVKKGKSDFITGYYLLSPTKTFRTVNVSVSFEIKSVLFTGFYYFNGQNHMQYDNFTLQPPTQ